MFYTPLARGEHDLFKTPLTFISSFCLLCVTAMLRNGNLYKKFKFKSCQLKMAGKHDVQKIKIKVLLLMVYTTFSVDSIFREIFEAKLADFFIF